MKKIAVIVLVVGCVATVSCRAGKGCRGNGKNVGAERILSGDAEALKAAKKAGKFKH